MTTVYRARLARTLDPANPTADHVAVDDGRIVAVGGAADMPAGAPVDERFADKVLVPGFVEGHTHTQVGALWSSCYCGRFARTGPDGTRWDELPSVDESMARLREWGEANPEAEVVFGWGFDPIYFGRTCTREDLDQVSDTRPVTLAHASLHIVSVNTPALALLGLLDNPPDTPSVPRGPDGLPTGELRGPEAAYPAIGRLGLLPMLFPTTEDAFLAVGRLAVRAGVTTMTDLGSSYRPDLLANYTEFTAREDWPVRLVPAFMSDGRPAAELFRIADEAAEANTEMLRLGRVKIVVDGSIQGFTARLRAGEYHNGAPNGLWYKTPEHIREVLAQALAEGRQVHLHTNGDQASELVLDILEELVAARPGATPDITLQHAQMMDEGLLGRAAALGLNVNLFANHIFYWGEAHAAMTIGEERAAGMDACATALRLGVPLSIHSDEPVTPIAPLFAMWCAVNRLTHEGRVLGPQERITPEQALHAVTMGPAISLGLDGEIGSLAVGKRADIAVLADDPLSVAPEAIRDIAVWGTVTGGRVFPADG